MPSWIYIFPTEEKKSPGLMGPYTGLQARRVADKIEARHEVILTVSSDPVRARREIKRKVIEEYGYEKGSKRFSPRESIVRETY